jgi:hypothetical protein
MIMAEKKTGTTIGHILASSFFLAVGVGYLLLDLRRTRNLRPGQFFCDRHVPERDPNVLRVLGIVMGFAAVVGSISEGMGGVVTFQDFFFQLLHETLYLAFGFAGLVTYLESKRRVPMDSNRVSMAIALLLNYLMMSSHSAMKTGSIDGSLHSMEAKLCLVNALMHMYSVGNPKSLFAFLLCHVLHVMIGVWMTTLGFYVCCFDIPLHWVETVFSLQLLLLFTLILAIAVIVLPPLNENEWLTGPEGTNKEGHNLLSCVETSCVEDGTESDSSNSEESITHFMAEDI